jgi:hypothetical protein
LKPADLTADYVRQVFFEHGYPLRTDRPTVFGVRLGPAGKFDDVIGILWWSSGVWICKAWKATTDPGIPYLVSPMNPQGCAAIAEGFYPGVWARGLHKGKPALVQVGAFDVHRDNDRDATLEFPNVVRVTGAGLNLHEMGDGQDARDVGKWSAGCQGTEDPAGVRFVVGLVPEGVRVDYALFGARDFPGLTA